MKQLVVGFFGEGPTDERYFLPLLTRYLAEVCAVQRIDAEILEPIPVRPTEQAFLDQMREIEREYDGLSLFFVHMDADDRDRSSILARKWHPWLGECKEPRRWIPVIPVRMLESWLLADARALSKTFLIPEPDIERITAGVSSENIADPKGKLMEIKRVGKQRRPDGLEGLVAQKTRFSKLEKLPSFQAFARDVEERLTALF